MPDDICWASYTKKTELVETLLDAGADIETRDRDGRSPLLNAVSGENIQLELVEELVKRGADINAQDKAGFSALHYCAQNKRPDIAQFLIENGATANLKDQWGNSPLFRSLGNRVENQQLIELLITNGADPYAKNESGVSVMDHVLRLKSHPNHEYFAAYHRERS